MSVGLLLSRLFWLTGDLIPVASPSCLQAVCPALLHTLEYLFQVPSFYPHLPDQKTLLLRISLRDWISSSFLSSLIPSFLIQTIYSSDESSAKIQESIWTGYAVVTSDYFLQLGSLPPLNTSQQAELTAGTRPLTLAKGSSVNIYTDSNYGFHIIHSYAPIWRAENFLTSKGLPIINNTLILKLTDCLTQQAAVLCYNGNSKQDSLIGLGNHKPGNEPEFYTFSMLYRLTLLTHLKKKKNYLKRVAA